MIIAVSTQERRMAKSKLRTQMKNYKIKIQDVADRLKEVGTPFHYNTVRKNLDKDCQDWNETILNLVEKMIEEKKNPQPVQSL